MSEPKAEDKQLIIKNNPSILLEIDDNNLLIRCNIPENVDVQKFILFLYRLNKSEFVEVILQAATEFCKTAQRPEIGNNIVEEFSRLWKNNIPAVRPTHVFKDRD